MKSILMPAVAALTLVTVLLLQQFAKREASANAIAEVIRVEKISLDVGEL